MSGSSADWWTVASTIITAVGVLAALSFSVWQIMEHRNTRVRESLAARRAQADLVSAWMFSPLVSTPDGSIRIDLANLSSLPVHDVVVAVVGIQGAVPDGALRTAHVATLPPGRFSVDAAGRPMDSSMGRRFGIEIAFTDQAGCSWNRSATGRLDELASSPPEHYGLSRPFAYVSLVPGS